MKQVTLNIPENKFSFFMKLVSSLKFIKVVEQNPEESPYNPEFVAKIQKSRQDYKEGKGRTVSIDELNALWK